MNRIAALLILGSLIISCDSDDNGAVAAPEPARPLSEVLAEDEIKIQEYLKTHYYNYQDFDSIPENFDFKIDLQKIPEGNTDLIPLIDQVESIEVSVPSQHFGIAGENTVVSHNLYYLVAREGVGESLSAADSSFVRYEGRLLNDTIFDQSNTENPVWFDLARLQAPLGDPRAGTAARGFSSGISNFKAGAAPVIEDDGTYSVTGYGVGLIIFPSGLGYYNFPRATIPTYSPLIFKIDLFAVNETDHDRDGITSIEEDTNGDGYLFNDDADDDGTPDYLDADTP